MTLLRYSEINSLLRQDHSRMMYHHITKIFCSQKHNGNTFSKSMHAFALNFFKSEKNDGQN